MSFQILSRGLCFLLFTVPGVSLSVFGQESAPPAATPESRVDSGGEPGEALHQALIERGREQARGHAVSLIPVVRSIFERSCRECHDHTVARPKGDFGHIMDLAAIREDPDLLVPGEPMDSELYLLVIDPEPDFRMPPVDSDHPQVTRAEARLIEQWILGGAPASADTFAETETVGGEEEAADTEPVGEASRGFRPRIAFAKAHPLLVHFPIALLLAGILAEALCAAGFRNERLAFSAAFRNERLAFAAAWCLWLGAAGSLFAVGSGWLNVDVAGHTDEKVAFHRWTGVAVAAMSVAALATRGLRKRKGKWMAAVFLLLLAALAVVVGLAGHSGGELVYGEGYFSLF